jgi:S-formylglutathione hydrolase FrmB
VRHFIGTFLALLLLGWAAPARATVLPRPWKLDRINRSLHGTLLDYTRNHGADRRIWSHALGQKRDLYVYLPPGFDPNCRYPACVWLHGFAQDEQKFAEEIVPKVDAAIVAGKLPPIIFIAPDGSLNGHPCLMTAGSFFVNCKAGRFEDFVIEDVWPFLCRNFPILPEREAHILAGVSMGGGAAFALAMKHRNQFKICAAFFPPLNTRWADCHGNYLSDFDPNCWGWKDDFRRRREPIAHFGVVTVRMKRLVGPVYGYGPEVSGHVSKENPAELLERLDIQPCDLAMYIGYGGKDEFNLDAQVESFLALAKARGICPKVEYLPDGKHDRETAAKLTPGLIDWMSEQLSVYYTKRP